MGVVQSSSHQCGWRNKKDAAALTRKFAKKAGASKDMHLGNRFIKTIFFSNNEALKKQKNRKKTLIMWKPVKMRHFDTDML